MNDLLDDNPGYRPCLLMAHTDAGYAALVGRTLRRRGWDVYQAHTGPEARRLARLLQADAVVLDTDLPGESGWLTCDKLTRELPLIRVILVADEAPPPSADLAAFVGADILLHRRDGLTGLLRAVGSGALPVA